MKLLITGTRGFIGQNFVLEAMRRDVDFITYDMSEGYLEPEALPFEGVTHVIHLGAISSTTETNVKKVMDANLTWAIGLFEECVKRGIHFQWSSSASVYGKREKEGGPFKASDVCMPLNLYAHSKYLLEQYIIKRDANIVWQGFRYFNVYGPHEDHKGDQASPYTKFTKQARETGVINIFEGSENIYRDFIHVDRVIDVHFKRMARPISSIYNVGTGAPRTFLDVARDVALITGARINTIEFPEHLKPHYQYYTCAG